MLNSSKRLLCNHRVSFVVTTWWSSQHLSSFLSSKLVIEFDSFEGTECWIRQRETVCCRYINWWEAFNNHSSWLIIDHWLHEHWKCIWLFYGDIWYVMVVFGMLWWYLVCYGQLINCHQSLTDDQFLLMTAKIRKRSSNRINHYLIFFLHLTVAFVCTTW